MLPGLFDQMDLHREDAFYFTDLDLFEGKEADISVMDWKSWKLKRKVRSSLTAESQALADAVDNLNCMRLFCAECIVAALLRSIGSTTIHSARNKRM